MTHYQKRPASCLKFVIEVKNLAVAFCDVVQLWYLSEHIPDVIIGIDLHLYKLAYLSANKFAQPSRGFTHASAFRAGRIHDLTGYYFFAAFPVG